MNNILDTDSLVSIFSKLPLLERLKCEQVCRKWRDLMPYSDIFSLNLADISWSEKRTTHLTFSEGSLTISQPVITNFWFRKVVFPILDRCGPFLVEFLGQPSQCRLLLTSETLEYLVMACPYLVKLNLYNTFIHVDCIFLFLRWRRLKYLNLAGVVFLNENRQAVTNFHTVREHFQTLVHSHPTLDQLNLAALKFVPEFANARLKKLHLQGLGLSDANLTSLTLTCPDLVSLGLNSCGKIHDFRPVAKLPNLEKLWVNFTSFSNKDLAAICLHCRKLSQLRIDGCQALTEFEPLRLLSKLSVLWIGPSPQFTDACLGRIARHGKLENLAATGCKLTDQGIRYLANLCKNLTEMSVARTLVTDEGLLCVLEKCQNLTFLNAQNTKVSNQFLGAVGSLAGKLATLYVQNCPEIDEDGFSELYQMRLARISCEELPQLTILTGGIGILVSSELCDKLKRFCNVNLIIRTPLLALPAATDT